MGIELIQIDEFYHNGITALIVHADLMLAELTLPEEQVAVINRAKTKLVCADRLIEKHLYARGIALEKSAVLDLAEIVEHLGLHKVADDIRVAYADL